MGGVYNLLRFGNILETGYGRIFDQPYGMFSLYYLPRNLWTYFFALPDRVQEFPYLKPDLGGMSLFVTTPAFLLTARALPVSRLSIAAWLAVAAVGSVYLLYFWRGFAQFGMRYTLDFTPFIIILAAIGCQSFVKLPTRIFVVVSIMIQLWGIAWWRFGQLNIP